MTIPVDPLDGGRDLARELEAGADPRASELVADLCDEIERVRRQVTRLGLDLHDEALQDVTALRNDLRLFRTQVATVVEEESRQRVVGRVDDFVARVLSLDAALRELAVATYASSLRQPLSATLASIAQAQPGHCNVDTALDPSLDSCSLTDVERITIVRVVQSALANVVQHSGANTASISVRCLPGAVECEVVDDGHGFDVDAALAAAGREQRLGLVGMRERVALLGGTFAASSRIGGPTSIRFRLPYLPAR